MRGNREIRKGGSVGIGEGKKGMAMVMADGDMGGAWSSRR